MRILWITLGDSVLPTFELFGFEISSYYFSAVVGVCISLIVFCFRAKHYQYTVSNAILFGMLFAVVQVVASKGMYVLAYFPQSIELVSSSVGADSWGVFFLFPALVWLFSKANKKDFCRTLNCFVPGLCIVFICAQIGCYLNGCCVGIWMNKFQIPVQLIEACCCYFLLMYLLYLEKQKSFINLYPVVLILHGGYRLVVDFVRVSNRELLLSRGQWLAVIAIVGGVFWLKRETNKHENKHENKIYF